MFAHSSYYPILLKIMRLTYGPVLEMGTGPFSTPLLHYFCAETNRSLVSYDNNIKYFNHANKFSTDLHQIKLVNNWDEVDILKSWSVVLIDHAPAERRIVDVNKLSQCAEYIVCHDSEPVHDGLYKFSTVYPLFKYRLDYTKLFPNTVILSNFHYLDPHIIE